ncbi:MULTISPECIES: cell envelope integrity protein TolA [Calothrix]|uniref:Cell envelope integrity protein TolA n=2 Tax=Calothrix TaxID=1186 RepID=A0ABR8A712_9CYAN|nr:MULTISPECIES: cell envelope integrity protein TolA [Calothrix]MBD2195628.1 cell envelope integrity protein TolA [Calothrix parietina FACHB-288]MBD2224047.1 cell envelope integrity protein TolA [Calothrix anomala FACHB-343]
MTPSVADQTSTLAKDWRRHTDPPGLWVAVVIGSLSLHLIAFWLILSYQSSLLRRQQSQAAIPIEIVEIAPQPKSTIKPRVKVQPATSPPKSVPSKPLSSNQKLPVTTKPTATNTEEKNAVAIAQQRQQELAVQKQRELAAQQRQQELAAQKQRELAAQQRQQQLAAQKQRELAAQQRQQELAAQKQRELAAQQRQQQLAEQQRQRELAEQQRQPELASQSPQGGQEKLPPPPTPHSSGGLFARWVPLSEAEQRGIPSRSPIPEDLKLAEHIGTNEKKVESIYINSNLDLPVVEFLVSLVIDNTGKFIEADVIDPAIPKAQRSDYEQYANDVFQGEKFQPAYYPDGRTPPELTNRFVRLRIERQ